MSYMFSGFGAFFTFLYITMFVLGIYCAVLFIKLAHRGIKALDIFINKNSNYTNNNQNQF